MIYEGAIWSMLGGCHMLAWKVPKEKTIYNFLTPSIHQVHVGYTSAYWIIANIATINLVHCINTRAKH